MATSRATALASLAGAAARVHNTALLDDRINALEAALADQRDGRYAA